MKHLTLILLAFVLLMAISVNAETQIQTLGTFKSGETVTLVQNCLTSSYSNISRIIYPNGTFALNTQTIMVKNGDDYSYSFSDTDTMGQYLIYGVCDESGTKTNWVYDFTITATGSDLTQAKSNSYLIIFIISILIFIGLVILGIYLPGSNKKDQFTGYIIAVSNVKYLKILFLGLAYMVSVFIGYLSWMIAYAYLDMEFVTTIFRFIFTAQVVLIPGLFILLVYLSIANAVRDSKLSEMLTRGLNVR